MPGPTAACVMPRGIRRGSFPLPPLGGAGPTRRRLSRRRGRRGFARGTLILTGWPLPARAIRDGSRVGCGRPSPARGETARPRKETMNKRLLLTAAAVTLAFGCARGAQASDAPAGAQNCQAGSQPCCQVSQ